jgi:hypothetical protein
MARSLRRRGIRGETTAGGPVRFATRGIRELERGLWASLRLLGEGGAPLPQIIPLRSPSFISPSQPGCA